MRTVRSKWHLAKPSPAPQSADSVGPGWQVAAEAFAAMKVLSPTVQLAAREHCSCQQ